MAKLGRIYFCKFLQYLLGLAVGYLLPLLLLPNSPDAGDQLRHSDDTGPQLGTLFVGVMTARRYLATRGCSAWRAWAKDIIRQGGEVRFFVGGQEEEPVWCNLPVVLLKGVNDNDYPPQKKSFLMLRWMAAHQGNRFRWFLRADDDVFVNADSLFSFLRSLNDTEAHYIGQAGRGRGQEEGHLALEWDQNFCMGGPGVTLSRTALMTVAPSLKSCLASLQTSHEDVEVGRCVHRATGVSCTWAYDMQALFYNNGAGEVDGGTSDHVLQHAISLHPLKNPENMETIGVHRRASRRRAARTEASRALRRAAAARRRLAKAGYQADLDSGIDLDDWYGLEELPGGTWDLVLNHYMYSINAGGPKRKVPGHLAQGLTRAVSYVLDTVNKEASEKGRAIEFRDLYYAYVNEHPSLGMTYILDLLLLYKRYRGKKMTVKVRRHVYVRQPFLPTVAKFVKDISDPAPLPVLGEDTPVALDSRQQVVFVVPLSGSDRLLALRRFLDNYEREVLSALQPAKLVIVVFRGPDDDVVVEAAREGVGQLENSYPGYSFVLKVVNDQFSRAVGLMTGADLCSPQDLLFLLDIDIQVSGESLNRIRRLVQKGGSVYFPIVFSEFRDGGGYWRDFGYGIVAVYKSDLTAVGGLDTGIHGWGKEDVDFYERFLGSNLTIWRSVDTGLVHRYHPVHCSAALPTDQATMCQTSRASTFLPLEQLVDIVLNSTLLKG